MYTQEEIDNYKNKMMDKIIATHELMQTSIEIESASSMVEASELLKFYTSEFKEWDNKISEETLSWVEHDNANLLSDR